MKSLTLWLVAVSLAVVFQTDRLAADEPKPTVVKDRSEIRTRDRLPFVRGTASSTRSSPRAACRMPEVDVLTNKVTVRYDPTRIKLQALIGRIGVIGYKATEVK